MLEVVKLPPCAGFLTPSSPLHNVVTVASALQQGLHQVCVTLALYSC